MKVISVLRTTSGLDDYPLFKYLANSGCDFMNFDDRVYVNHEVFGFLPRLSRAIFRDRHTEQFNKQLRQYINAMRPDIFLYFKAASIHGETITMANGLNCRTICIYPDLDPAIHGSKYLEALKHSEILYHTKPNHTAYFNKLNKNSAALGVVYDEELTSDIEAPDPRLGVVFVGHHSSGKQDFLRELSLRYTGTITIYGDRWSVDMFRQARSNVVVHPAIYGSSVQEVYRRSLCVLGLLQERITNQVGGDEITARTIQVPIYGGLLLHKRTEQAERVFSDTSELLYDNAQDLCEKILKLQSSPQMRLNLSKKQKTCAIKYGTGAREFIQGLIR